MATLAFRNLDAFASSVRDVESVMLLRNPARRRWVIDHVFPPSSILIRSQKHWLKPQPWPEGRADIGLHAGESAGLAPPMCNDERSRSASRQALENEVKLDR